MNTLTDLQPQQIGPAIAGRLKGRLFNIAMSLQFFLPDGTLLAEAAALAHPGTPPDPTTGYPGTQSGGQRVITLLSQQFSGLPQDLLTGSIDAFEAHEHGNMTM